MFKYVVLATVLFCSTAAHTQDFFVSSGGQARSEVVPNFLGGTGGEYPFVNAFKGMQLWNYGNNGNVSPIDLDANGWPIPGSNGFSHTGYKSVITRPTQAVKPGHYVMSAIGNGAISAFDASGSSSTTACNGTASGISCDNTACTDAQGYISGTSLTITTASNCNFVQYLPISGPGITISQFGVPTIITNTNGHTGLGTYVVNFSQTVGSSGSPVTIHPGIRNEVTAGTETAIAPVTWDVSISKSTSGNAIQYVGFYHINDEAAYATGNLASPDFKARIKQGNFAVLRDLNWGFGNIANCSTWATRKPASYYSYNSSEYRNASSGPGQFVDANGDGASGGTISYNSGTDTFSISLGSGNFADKQTILVKWPATGDSSSVISLNGNAAVPILSSFGVPLSQGFNTGVPTLNLVSTLVYDAQLGSPLSFGGTSNIGLNCGVPPEAFIEMNVELGTTPFIEAYMFSLDPMTDFLGQYASYIKTNYPAMVPEFEVLNEPWNCAGPYPPTYISALVRVYIAADPAAWSSAGAFCGSSGNTPNEIGKMASTAGQQLSTVYNAGQYKLLVGVQTVAGTNASSWNGALTSAMYLAQNPSLIPIQPGYTQTAASNYVTNPSINNYWALYENGSQQEVADAYNYFNGSASTQAAIMASYMGTESIDQSGNGSSSVLTYISGWNTWAAGFGIGGPLMYEGTYAPGSPNGLYSADIAASVAFISTASTAVVTTEGTNGCVANMPVALSGINSTGWATSYSGLTVQSTAGGTCTVNLNSSGLGNYYSGSTTASANWTTSNSTISVASCAAPTSSQSVYDLTTSNYVGTVSSCTGTTLTLHKSAAAGGSNGDTLLFSNVATLTYVGSENWANYLRENSYLSSQLFTLTLKLYAECVANGCTNPSQFTLGGGLVSGYPWTSWSPDIYGYLNLAKCTSCTISGTTLTLGGTITGIFDRGQTLFGGGLPGGVTITGSCSTSGSGPCGSNSGDTLTISTSETISSGTTLTGNATPPLDPAGTATNSPITQWQAIRYWNSNSGGFLLKRDLGPSFNDNSPVGLAAVG